MKFIVMKICLDQLNQQANVGLGFGKGVNFHFFLTLTLTVSEIQTNKEISSYIWFLNYLQQMIFQLLIGHKTTVMYALVPFKLSYYMRLCNISEQSGTGIELRLLSKSSYSKNQLISKSRIKTDLYLIARRRQYWNKRKLISLLKYLRNTKTQPCYPSK